ncbi:MAG: hypothetical protein WCA08_06970 [Desulfoferrobacter sp.]
MDPLKMTKQMIEFNKATFDNTFSAMVMLQEQTEAMVNSFVEQANWVPEEGKKVLDEWLASYKKGRNEFKKTVDQSFKKVENYFAEAGKSR